MTDNLKASATTGHLLHNAAGHLIYGCAVAPCTACSGTQTSAVVSLPNGCSSYWNPLAGTYTYAGYANVPSFCCCWKWDGPGIPGQPRGSLLWIEFNKNTGIFTADAYRNYGHEFPCQCNRQTITGSLACNSSGFLIGTFTFNSSEPETPPCLVAVTI